METNQVENINLEILKKQKLEYEEDPLDDLEDQEEIKKGTNPLLWNKPTYAAVSISSTNNTENPNAYWKDWAEKQNQS
jgi:hypothetical protein